MKLKKVLALSVAMAALAGATLNVSAAQTSIDKYVNGLKKGKQVDLILDVEAYRAAYGDLEEAFGDDWDAYIEHYLTAGVYEGRTKGVLFDPLAYAEGYADIEEAFGGDVLAIVNHYVNYGVKENRTTGTAAGYADIASAIAGGAVQSPVRESVSGSYAATGSTVSTGEAGAGLSAGTTAGNPFDTSKFGHTTSIYSNDYSTLLRVEYYDENGRLIYYSSVADYDSSTNSYTENIYSYDEEKGEVLEHVNVYVNGTCSSKN